MNSKGAAFFSQIDFGKKSLSIVILVNISFEGISTGIYWNIPRPLLFLWNLEGSEKSWMWNCPVGKDRSSFVSQIIRMSILLFTTLTNESNLFAIEFMFNWAHINLFTFLSLRFLRISFGSPVWADSVDPLFGVSQLWLFFIQI